jgi:hypothetical protein
MLTSALISAYKQPAYNLGYDILAEKARSLVSRPLLISAYKRLISGYVLY